MVNFFNVILKYIIKNVIIKRSCVLKKVSSEVSETHLLTSPYSQAHFSNKLF